MWQYCADKNANNMCLVMLCMLPTHSKPGSVVSKYMCAACWNCTLLQRHRWQDDDACFFVSPGICPQMFENLGKVYESQRKGWKFEEKQGNQPYRRKPPAKNKTVWWRVPPPPGEPWRMVLQVVSPLALDATPSNVSMNLAGGGWAPPCLPPCLYISASLSLSLSLYIYIYMYYIYNYDNKKKDNNNNNNNNIV